MSDDLEIPAPTYRVPRQKRGMDAGTRKLAIIAGGLGGALVLLVGGWSVLGHRSAGVPVIEADSRPLRVKPDNPGGMQVAGTNEEILSGDADGQTGKLAPAAETPEPQNLKAPAPLAAAPAPPPPAAVAATPPAAVAAAPAIKPPAPVPPGSRAVAVEHLAPQHATGGEVDAGAARGAEHRGCGKKRMAAAGQAHA